MPRFFPVFSNISRASSRNCRSSSKAFGRFLVMLRKAQLFVGYPQKSYSSLTFYVIFGDLRTYSCELFSVIFGKARRIFIEYWEKFPI